MMEKQILSVKIDISATFKDLGSYVLVLIVGTSLTSYKFNRGHPVV
jgi:hypothetical protein